MADETTMNGGDALTNGGARMSPRAMAGDLGSRASDLASQAPAAMNSAVESAAGMLNESTAAMQASPDEVLAIGTALSTGIAIGLIIGGAPRLLIGAALIPSAAMGFTLMSRYTDVRPRNGARAKASA
ncbi:MAG TPA: hypothetical protein VFS32_09820 [Candidatus Limnocylindrales bacterium]|nr:hypothetical protein [Candidatus Limnocylindrales bacterium]